MQIIRLIYASVARPGFSLDDYRQIRASAKAFNTPNGISGILCFSGGAFLQAIEGRRVHVNQLYNRIVRDTRHHDTEILSCTPIDMRSFIDWSMKMISFDEAYTPQRRELVMRHSGMQAFEPWTMSAGQALSFLTELAEVERRKDLRLSGEMKTVG